MYNTKTFGVFAGYSDAELHLLRDHYCRIATDNATPDRARAFAGGVVTQVHRALKIRALPGVIHPGPLPECPA